MYHAVERVTVTSGCWSTAMRGCRWSSSVSQNGCVHAKQHLHVPLPHPHANGALPFLIRHNLPLESSTLMSTHTHTHTHTHKFNYVNWFRSSNIFKMAAGNYNETTWQHQPYIDIINYNQGFFLSTAVRPYKTSSESFSIAVLGGVTCGWLCMLTATIHPKLYF